MSEHIELAETEPRVTSISEQKETHQETDAEAGVQGKAALMKAERRLVRKLDIAILPFSVLLYLSAYLDRGNVANARLQGMERDVLRGSDSNYSLALATFFIAYIVCSIPGTLMAKQFNPSRTIAVGAMIWSVAATLQAAAFNPAGFFVARFFVGVGESMFGQAMGFHLSLWYTKGDLAKRVGLFISSGALAGAFGGLIAFGISSVERTSIKQWQILFLIEGVPSVILATATWFFMPNRPESTRYLNEEERELCLRRLGRSISVESQPGIAWKGVIRCVKDWKVYLMAVMYSCMNLTLASVGGFLPTIVKGFGYSNAQAQLLTVPPYAVALVFMLCLTAFSDWKQARGFPVVAVFILGIVGWAILLAVPAAGASHAQYSVRYFGCCLITTAAYTNIPLIISWQAANNPNESQRATALGYLNSIGQGLSLAAAFLFPSVEGPQYIKGSIINIAFQALGLVIALTLTAFCRWENRRRDREEGGRPEQGASLDTYDKFDYAPG
ncbi:major facilitator superfamily domain-containing protein [Naematelia encephala]|uniref:Major facilitator superfamily domain-containing protein n=1 Tax=Naematelia encephala TaxID=71784 RepID=A0A1Y2B290_9TREE|nr:major facilitator superfamily domain-containing protein [Naematelia encephala]